MQKQEVPERSDSIELRHLRQVEKELSLRLRQQAALTRMGQSALSAASWHRLVEEIAGITTETLDADLCLVFENQLDGQLSVIASSLAGPELEGAGPLQVPVNQSQAGYTLQSSEPVIVSDLSRETRFTDPALQARQITSGLSVLISGKERPFGVLSVHTYHPRHFNPDDAFFLQNVANLLASALVRFRAENVVRSSRDQLAVILQGVSDGVMVQDAGNRFVYANSTAARILGFPDEQALVNTPVPEIFQRFDFYDEQGQPLPLEELPTQAALRNKAEAEATVHLKDRARGMDLWTFLRAYPITSLNGDVELVINIIQDVTGYRRVEQSRRLLAEAGGLLSASLDTAEIANHVARLAVAYLADWCVVYLVEEGSHPRTAAVAHVDPERVRLAYELQEKYPPDWEASHGVAAVIASGLPEFIPQVSQELIKERVQDEEQYRLIHALGLRAAILLPLKARGRVIGALSLIWAESARSYQQEDIDLAEELARLSALAIDNASLYRKAQDMNTDLEGIVNRRTHQLQTSINLLRTEIQERKKAEEALRESERMLESLFESAPDATILVNADGEIILANQQVEAVFGYGRSELVGKVIEDLLPGRMSARHTAHRLAYLSERERRPMGLGLELYGKRKDGQEFPIDIMLSPVETSQGPLVICAIRDITERKEMEAELAEVQQRLIESVEAERLTIAQDLHDGPIQDLYGINFYLNSLGEKIDPDARDTLAETRELVTQIIQTLRSMCSDLRPPSLAPFGLEKAIRAHLEKLGESSPELEIHLSLKPDEQLLPERTRLALFRIYQHAVSNVIRHAEATRLDVELDFDERELRMQISDNGKGFKLPRRWVELARQGHLGLVGTAERAEAIGARLKIDSSPGQGTVINIHLPLEVEAGKTFRSSWIHGL